MVRPASEAAIVTELLEGRVAIVTGASRGIGARIAVRLAGMGARVTVDYLSDGDAADAVIGEIRSSGGHAIALRADVRREDDISFLV